MATLTRVLLKYACWCADLTGALKNPPKQKPPLRFLLIRHGRSEANARQNAEQYGLTEDEIPDLTGIPDESVQLMHPIGFDQADACGHFLHDYLRDNPVDGGTALYCSSYMRARQTAQRIYDNIVGITGPALRRHESDFLIEQHHGFMDGLSDAERREKFPEYALREDMHWNNGSKQFAPIHGGEMRVTVAHRVATFLDTVFREHHDHGVNTFVIVNHGITMRQIAKYLLKMPRESSDKDTNPFNCDIRLLQRQLEADGGMRLRDFGYIWHDSKPQPPQLTLHPTMDELFAQGAFRDYKPRTKKLSEPKL